VCLVEVPVSRGIDLLACGEDVPQRRFDVRTLSSPDSHPRQVRRIVQESRMRRAQLRLANPHAFLEDRLRFVEPSLLLERNAQRVQRLRVLDVSIAEHPTLDDERFAQQRFRLRRPALCEKQ
jgi:hypothetical protein